MLIGVEAGYPLRFTTKVAVADVTAPDESFETFNVMVAVPLPADSAPVTAGTSSDGRSAAVNVCVPLPEVMLGESVLVHAETTARETTSAIEVTYFILSTPVIQSDCQRN